MPLVGNTFTRLYSWVNDAASGIDIDPARTDQDSNDIAAAISQLAANLIPLTAKLTIAYGLGPSDAGKLFSCNGTFALTLPATTAVLNGFAFDARNDGSGVVTLTPQAGETIDGLPALRCLAGQAFSVYSDGAGAWRTVGRQSRVLLNRTTISAATPSLILALPAGYEQFELIQSSLILSTTASILGTLSFDGGVTYKAGSSDYVSNAIDFTTASSGFSSVLAYFYATFATSGGLSRGVFSPGATGVMPSGLFEACGSTGPYFIVGLFGVSMNVAYGRATNVKLAPLAGTINAGEFQLYGIASQ